MHHTLQRCVIAVGYLCSVVGIAHCDSPLVVPELVPGL